MALVKFTAIQGGNHTLIRYTLEEISVPISDYSCCKRYIIYRNETSLYYQPIRFPVCVESDGYVARYLLDKFNGNINNNNTTNDDGTE